ncbi:MAG TPA: hypothetical protein VLH08_15260, partial [Acidobacteriota bacterium]|nr:hypothetical protein [Acidobacteriota bacterium]
SNTSIRSAVDIAHAQLERVSILIYTKHFIRTSLSDFELVACIQRLIARRQNSEAINLHPARSLLNRLFKSKNESFKSLIESTLLNSLDVCGWNDNHTINIWNSLI